MWRIPSNLIDIMAKAELDLVKVILQRNDLDIRTVSRIMEDLQREIQAQQTEEKPPPVKKQFVVLVSDPNGDLEGHDMTGWVVQIPEDDPVRDTEDRLFQSAYDYNASPKGRKMTLQTIAETCEHVPTRVSKEHNVWIKTKEPVEILPTRNKVPSTIPDKLKDPNDF